jgi:peptide-methionine (S)-S-oxide reductase
MDGVIRTRVGYAGGTQENPSYYRLGDHSETVQIDYDPDRITYRELVDVFWQSHNPCSKPWSRQYMSIVFYHNVEQRKLAEETKEREEALQGKPILTEILPASEFYLAEAYHQKYYLRQELELLREYKTIYPDEIDFVNSTAVARVNSYIGGYGKSAALEEGLDSLGLSQLAAERLRYIVSAN